MKLIPLPHDQEADFRLEMQQAFQQGYEAYYGPTDTPVLPDADVDDNLRAPGAIALQVIDQGERKGGAIIIISPDGQQGELCFLYVRVGCQNQGIASFLWRAIESQYPHVRQWETCTPYFDKRNIHFYVNKQHFHIVEFYTAHHPDPHCPSDDPQDPLADGLFRFLKQMPAREE